MKNLLITKGKIITTLVTGLTLGAVGATSAHASSLRFSADGDCGAEGIETTIPMVTADCISMGGTVVHATPWGWGDCRLDLCEDGDYALAGAGECQNRDGYGIIGMPAGDCRAIGGAMNGNPGNTQWTACHLDLCEEGGLEIASPGQAGQKAYGIVHTNRSDCENLKGGMNPNFDLTRDCHLGLVDAFRIQGLRMIVEDAECGSRQEYLGNFATLEECAEECLDNGDCEVFLFGKNSADGDCYQEYTTTLCPEGGRTNPDLDVYDFGANEHIRITWHTGQIAVPGHRGFHIACPGDGRDLKDFDPVLSGGDVSLDECALRARQHGRLAFAWSPNVYNGFCKMALPGVVVKNTFELSGSPVDKNYVQDESYNYALYEAEGAGITIGQKPQPRICHVYKGRPDNEDLEYFSDPVIQAKLRYEFAMAEVEKQRQLFIESSKAKIRGMSTDWGTALYNTTSFVGYTSE